MHFRNFVKRELARDLAEDGIPSLTRAEEEIWDADSRRFTQMMKMMNDGLRVPEVGVLFADP